MTKDDLGQRMKEDYEGRTQTHLMRRSHTIIRLDGKAFHTYTKGFDRPYDLNLMRVMDDTAIELCRAIQGAKMAYVQSDEISILLTDFETPQTDMWFDGNVQKITSVSASIATAAFNNAMMHLKYEELGEEVIYLKPAYFDSRVFQVPNVDEVINNFIWRQQDATRNSIQMGAQALYSQKQLDKKNTSELQELMFQKGVNWNDYPVGFKRGRLILKEKQEQVEIKNPRKPDAPKQFVNRIAWASFDPPIFSQEKDFLRSRIPKSEFLVRGENNEDLSRLY